MRILICIVAFICFHQVGDAQSDNYKDSVELLLNETRKGNKVYRDH